MTRTDLMIDLVQRQLDAYNQRDLDAWLKTYAPDAQQFEYPNKLLAQGHAEIRARTAPRFQEPDLHAQLLRREVIGHQVIDEERVTRNFSEGLGTIDMTCIYDIAKGRIQKATFVMGDKVIFSNDGEA